MVLIDALLDKYAGIGFRLSNNSNKSLSVVPTFIVAPKTAIPIEGQVYSVKNEPVLDCSLNIFVSGLTGGFTVDPSEKGLRVSPPHGGINSISKISGTTKFIRHGMWLISIGYALDKTTTTQRDVGNMNKTFKVKLAGDSLHIERKIENANPQYAMRYVIVVKSDSSLIIKELTTPATTVIGRWLKRNMGTIISLIGAIRGG